jgi:hypothetical protein
MSFLDRLRDVVGGIGDIITAPVGFIWDTVRATASEQYNPGFQGLFGSMLDQGVGGIAKIGEATGLSELGRDISAATPVDEVIQAVLHEGELMYSTEYQHQTNQVPIWAMPWEMPAGTPGAQGVEPGEQSIQIGGAIATGAVGSALPTPGGEPISAAVNPVQLYRRAQESTPGRAFVDSQAGFYQMSREEQNKLRAQGWYIGITGSIDAVARWYLQPEVLLGKGIKKVRQFQNPNVAQIISRAEKATGKTFKALEETLEARPEGPVYLQIANAPENAEMIHVTRQSAMRNILGDPHLTADFDADGFHFRTTGTAEGLKRLPVGADTAYHSAVAADSHAQILNERFGDEWNIDPQGLSDEFYEWLDEITVRGGDSAKSRSLKQFRAKRAGTEEAERLNFMDPELNRLFQEYIGHKTFEGSTRMVLRGMGVTDDLAVEDISRRLADFDTLQEVDILSDLQSRYPDIDMGIAAGRVDQEVFVIQHYLENPVGQPPIGLNSLLDSLNASGTGQNTMNRVGINIHGAVASRAEAAITKDNFAGRGAWGAQIQNEAIIPQGVAPEYKGIYLLDSTDMEEAKRYAAALYRADPTDPPVVIHIKANGLPVIFEDYTLPTMPDPLTKIPGGQGLPMDASLMTLVDKIGPENVTNVTRFTAEELDATANIARTVPGYLDPGGRMEPRMFHPDGRPQEPWEIINIEDVADDLVTGTYLWNQNPIEAQKFFDARARERAWNAVPPSENPVERAMNHKNVQRALNQMDGKSADQIRRIWFSNHPFGQVLASQLAEAKGYMQRRAVLAASMGLRLPEFDTLPQVLKAKLSIATREFEKVKNGIPGQFVHDERMLALLGEPSRYKNLTPEEMTKALQETIDTLEDQQGAVAFLDEMSRHPVLREVPKTSDAAILAERVRTSHFYQQSPFAAPIRVVTEMRPHRWVNVKDGNADIQLVRQLEEAAPSLNISSETIRGYRERFMNATNDAHRIQILNQAEDEIIRAAATKAGLSKKEFEQLLESAQTGRARVSEFLGSKRYGPDGKDQVPWFDEDTGETIVLAMPMMSTQLRTWVPMADVRVFVRHASKLGRLRQRLGANAGREILDLMMGVWKPTVLLRGGWMVRVVADEQLRILAMSGSLLKHLAAVEAGENISFSGIFKPGRTAGERAAEAFSTVALTQPATALAQRAMGVVSRASQRLHLVDKDYLRWLKEAGFESRASSRASFAGPNESMYEEMSALFGQSESQILNHLFSKGTGNWQSVSKESRMYGPAWLRVLNSQIRKDPLAHRMAERFLEMLEDSMAAGGGRPLDKDLITSGREVLEEFIETAEGKEILGVMPWRAVDTQKWADDLTETLIYYTGDLNPNVLKKVVTGGLKEADLEDVDEAIRPATVHAEVVEQTLGKSVVTQFLNDFVAGSFDLMGRLPTDTLSRQPFFKQLWADEMVRLERHANKMGIDIDEQWIKRSGAQAKEFAIHEVREYLYDLAEVSRVGEMVRWIMPFFPAWQEVIKVWGKLSIRDPSIPARGYLLWKAPNRAGIVVKDEEGEEYIQVRLAEKMATDLGLTGWTKYVATGGVQFGKSSFNLALANPLPGVGPLIQMPINEVSKRKPELESSLKFLLPYGVKADSTEIITSPLVRQLGGELSGVSGTRSYQRDFYNALTWMDVQYRQGLSPVPPTIEEAHQIAAKINTIRGVARTVAPSQPIFNSPLEPYIDIYRDMIETLGPQDADEAFLNEYGEEFMAVTLSRTVSETGLPPTVEAEVARDQFESLVTKYPEFGSLIVGDEAVGEFSSAAFASQLTRPMDPNNPNSEMERNYRFLDLDPATGQIEEVDRRLGWQKYVQALDQIDLERRRRGLPNLRVTAAQDLAAIKSAITQQLATQYPAWWRDFNQRDELKWQTRIDGFREIANNPLMVDRPDMMGIREYLAAREVILQELNRRKMQGGASTLDALSNQDLAMMWDSIVTKILENNIAFAPVYYRYLEADPVTLRSNSG